MSSAPIECLVTWEGRKQVLFVGGDRKKSDVINAAMLADSWASLQCDRIEVYNSRFDTYVDVPEGHTFSDGDKINLVGSSSSDEQNLPLETGTDDGPLVLAPSCSEPDKRLFTVQQPLYELPPIPLDIKADIEGTTLGEVSSRTKNRIVSSITAHLLTIDWYPGKFYEPAAKALVLKYPVLRDTIGTGYDSWRVAFKFKIGNIRKSVDNDPNVEEARKKFGRKGNFQDKSGLKKQCRVPRDTLETTVEEVDGVVAAHVDFMAKEMKRCNPDIQKLKVSMQTTLPSRRKWIKINSPSTEELLDKYPALTLREMIHQEFMEICKVDFERKLLGFINGHGQRLFSILKTSRTAQKFSARYKRQLLRVKVTQRNIALLLAYFNSYHT
ncbi:sterile alpha motif domain-containing protein 3-like [Amblyomma americanum]